MGQKCLKVIPKHSEQYKMEIRLHPVSNFDGEAKLFVWQKNLTYLRNAIVSVKYLPLGNCKSAASSSTVSIGACDMVAYLFLTGI